MYRFDNMDASESAWFGRQLEASKATLVEVEYPNLKGTLLVPVNNSVDPAATTFEWKEMNRVGAAKMIASQADDLPRVDVFGSQNFSPIHKYGAAYGWDTDEVLRSAKTGIDLPGKKAKAARDAIADKTESLIRTGDSSLDLKGFVNRSDVQAYTIPADGTGSVTTWAQKTGTQINRDMSEALQVIVNLTKEKHVGNTLVIPTSSYGYINNTQFSTASDLTILEYFKRNHPGVEVISWYALETAGAASAKRMIAYDRSPEVLEFLQPVEFDTLAPQVHNFEFVVNCFAKTGGVIVYRPLCVVYADGI